MTRAGQCLIYVVAFLLPWWSYIDLPQYLVFPLVMFELALVLLFVVDSVWRGLRAPFEYLLPLGVLAAVNVFGYVGSFWTAAEFWQPLQPIYFLEMYLYPFVALAVVHFARRRQVALTALDVLAVSVGVWSGVMLSGRVSGLFPTAGLMGTDGWRLPDLTVYGIVAAVFGAARRERGSTGRRFFEGAAGLSVAAFLVLGLGVLDVPLVCFSTFAVYVLGWWLVGNLLTFWPVARIAAKVEVARRESEEKRDAVYLLVLMGLAALALVRYWLGQTNEFFVVALAGAWALPERESGWYKPDWRLAGVLGALCALIGFNLVNVNPHNFRDPRNYVPEPFFQEHGFEQVAPRLERVEARYPMETQTNFWLAQAKLSQGELYDAAMEYRESLRTKVTRTGERVKTILPHPTAEQRRGFMDKLRDRSSAMAPGVHQGAYVVALIGEERYEEAVSLMRKDAAGAAGAPEVDEPGRAVFAWGVSVYVYDLGLYERLADWTARDLLSLLVAWGAQIERAADGSADDCLPTVILARTGMCEASRPELVAGDGVRAVCLPGDGGLAIGRGRVEACSGEAPVGGTDGSPVVVVRVKLGRSQI